MAEVSVEILDVVVPDDIAGLKCHVALTTVSHVVAAAVEDAVGPVCPAPDAALDYPGMPVATRVTMEDRREDLYIRFVQELRPLSQASPFPRVPRSNERRP